MNVQPLSDDEAAAAGLLGLCCCLLALVGVGVLIFFLVRKSGSAGRGPVAQPPGVHQQAGGGMLSVLAVGLDSSVRAGLEAQLAAPSSAPSPVQARVELVQRTAQALQAVSAGWRSFGYGEKALGDLAAAEQSYRLALDDFRQRGALPGDPGGRLVVLAVLVATRSALPGVSRLDDTAQLRELLTNCARVDASQLLGAEVVWAPASGGMTDDTLAQRFPEMHRLVS